MNTFENPDNSIFHKKETVFQSFLSFLTTEGEITTDKETARQALRFLIESYSQRSPNHWPEIIEGIIADLKSHSDSPVELNWRLANLIDQEHLYQLEKKLNGADTTTKEKIQVIKQIILDKIEMDKQDYNNGFVVSFGGITENFWQEY